MIGAAVEIIGEVGWNLIGVGWLVPIADDGGCATLIHSTIIVSCSPILSSQGKNHAVEYIPS